jgi:hypothetical protein
MLSVAAAAYVPRQVGEIITRLDEVDRLLREEIRVEVENMSRDVYVSSRLACLIRSRSDVQNAVTALLGAGD